MKPGYQTTEFWLTVVSKAFGLALIIIGVRNNEQNLTALGTAMISGGAIGYGVSRGLAKRGNGTQ